MSGQPTGSEISRGIPMKFGQVEALVFVLETFLRLPITKVYLPLLAFEIAHHFLFLLLGAGPYALYCQPDAFLQ
jgi:hypothetical protein